MQDISVALARQYAEDEQSKRIYKLLLYICEGIWEAEVNTPTEMAMLGLVRQLLNQFPDRTILTTHLQTSVNTLSKPAAYSQIADFIIETIALLEGTSSGTENSTAFLRTPTVPNRTAEAYEIERRVNLITETLIQQPKRDRIKKLLLCVDRSTWENDPSRLEMIPWREILHSLYQQYPQIEILQQATHKVVDHLSKPIEYGIIAQIALQQIQPLYQPLNLLPPIDGNSSDSAQPGSSESRSESRVGPAIDPDLTPIPVTLWKLESTPISPHIFDLRHDIIKSGNPLRVKHLLLMLTLGLDAQDALDDRTLRQETTLPLVATAFRLHRKPEILTIKLREIARKLPEPDEYEGAIDAIVRAFKAQSPKDHDRGDRSDRVVPLRNLSNGNLSNGNLSNSLPNNLSSNDSCFPAQA